jgi:DNA-binding response OmpR family regulator
MIKVMLIEDDPNMVTLIAMLLDLEGYIVKTPTDHHVGDLISELIKERPQVALVDVNLQLGSGLDIVREIRLKPEIKNTRILMYSGLYLKDECLKAGADGFIQKPFMPDELLKLIHTNSHQS